MYKKRMEKLERFIEAIKAYRKGKKKANKQHEKERITTYTSYIPHKKKTNTHIYVYSNIEKETNS